MTLAELMRTIATDARAASRALAAQPTLATAALQTGATRESPAASFIHEIEHYMYAGDTALHIAAAAYRVALVRELVALGADVAASNRRGQAPLHYAVDGGPGTSFWDPDAQARTIAALIAAGADPNAVDKQGVTALHRAVRNRCAAAVRALLEAGADVRRKNGSGSTPAELAKLTTGRAGSGSPAAKEQQAEILELLSARL